MKVLELIDLLLRADPEAEVFSEFEGDFGPVEPDEVRVGDASLVGGSFYDDAKQKPMEPRWMRNTHPYVEERKQYIVQRAEGVLFFAGQSSDEWPNKLIDRKERTLDSIRAKERVHALFEAFQLVGEWVDKCQPNTIEHGALVHVAAKLGEMMNRKTMTVFVVLKESGDSVIKNGEVVAVFASEEKAAAFCTTENAATKSRSEYDEYSYEPVEVIR